MCSGMLLSACGIISVTNQKSIEVVWSSLYKDVRIWTSACYGYEWLRITNGYERLRMVGLCAVSNFQSFRPLRYGRGSRCLCAVQVVNTWRFEFFLLLDRLLSKRRGLP